MTCTVPCITRVQQRLMCAIWSLTTGAPDVPDLWSHRKNERVMSVVLTHPSDMSAVRDGKPATPTHDHQEISPHPSRYWAPLSTRYMELLACTRAHVFFSGLSTGDGHSDRAMRMHGRNESMSTVSHQVTMALARAHAQWMMAPFAANPEIVSKLGP